MSDPSGFKRLVDALRELVADPFEQAQIHDALDVQPHSDVLTSITGHGTSPGLMTIMGDGTVNVRAITAAVGSPLSVANGNGHDGDVEIGSPFIYIPNQVSFSGSLAFGNGLRNLVHTTPETGYNNLAFGIDTLLNITTGYYNIGFGGGGNTQQITTGHGNIAIGWSAGYSLTTGIDNTLIGSAAGVFITTEMDNTAIGVNALRNIAGAENVGVGVDASLNTTSGSQNVSVGGWSARFLNDGVTPKLSGSLNVYIGYNVQSLANGTTNEIVIGSTADGAGSNSVVLGNDSIVKTLLKGSVVIGLTTPDVTFNPKVQIKSATVDAVNPVPVLILNRQNSNTPGLVLGIDAATNPTIGANGGAAVMIGVHAAGTAVFTPCVNVDATGVRVIKGGIGYATGVGAGGSVTQITSKTTAVTLNKSTGKITMHNAALLAGANAVFALQNTAIEAKDMVIVNVLSGYVTGGSYRVQAEAVSAGQCFITLTNTSAGSLSEAVAIRFAVIKSSDD